MASRNAIINRPNVYDSLELPNNVKKQLLKNDAVLFAAYKVPHPLEKMLEFKIQTKEETTPFSALYYALTALQSEFAALRRNFKKQAQELKCRQMNLRR